MHDEAFADSVRPAPCVILRLPMRDYSIGHELLLYRRRNPFVTLDNPAKFSQLPPMEQHRAVLEAAQVCGRSWAENERWPDFTGGWHKRSLIKMGIGQAFRMHWLAALLTLLCAPLLWLGMIIRGAWRNRWLRLWGWLVRNDDYGYAINEFWHYRRMGSLYPARPIEALQELRKENDNRTLGGPYLARLYLFASQIMGAGPACPWDFRLGEALFLAMTKAEAEGGLSIESEEDIEARAHEAKLEAKIQSDYATGAHLKKKFTGGIILAPNQTDPRWAELAAQQAEAEKARKK